MNSLKYIILGLTPQGLSLVRILGKAGYDVVAFYNNRKSVGRFCKYGRKIYFETVEELKKNISDILYSLDYKPLCYITSGELLAMVLQYFPELYSNCDVISGSYDVIETLAHKDRMYKIAESKGLKVAEYITLDNYKSGMFEFPVFLKRNYEIPLFFKAVKIESPQVLNEYCHKIEEKDKKHILIQSFIDIKQQYLLEISSQGYFCNGLAKGFLVTNQKRRLKKGITSYIEELDDSEFKSRICGLCAAFMQDIDYTGFAEFEFMYNSKTHDLYFIEVNTRTCGLQSALNYKFSNIIDVLLNPHNPPDLIEQIEHLKWMNIQRDIRARIEKKNFKHLLDIFRSKFDILDIHDLKPFFGQIL